MDAREAGEATHPSPMTTDPRSRPLLSIVVPTRNRAAYAISAIQSILEIDDSRLELVVQDNSDERDLEEWLTARPVDRRLKYNHSRTPLSFIHNFDAAARLTSGEYLCFIGDDDGVNPEIVAAAAWASAQDLDALVVKSSSHYLWRGTGLASTLFTEVTGGTLTIGDFKCTVVWADVEQEVRALLRNGGLYYLDAGLPKLYHGLVHRRCLEAVYNKTGAYFGGLSPDTYASLAIACVARRVAVIDYPLTIPGSCAVSGAILEGAHKRHSKRLADAPHLRHRGEYEWSPLVPRVYTVESIWVDSSLAALRDMGRDDLISQLDLPRHAALNISANDGVTRAVLRDFVSGLRAMHRSVPGGVALLAWRLALRKLDGGARLMQRVRNRLQMILGRRAVQQIDDLEDMVQATHALTAFLAGRGQTFSRVVSSSVLGNTQPMRSSGRE
ncbi:MAG: hypothetical protein JWL61_3781 [Gemmatimonadetes bacterium]|jgi:hypothetical protein|nr:hypothetical protein [Gemmatimonadota bacterium]